jgi:hypothetical protein
MLLSPFSRTGDRKIDRDKLIYQGTSPPKRSRPSTALASCTCPESRRCAAEDSGRIAIARSYRHDFNSLPRTFIPGAAWSPYLPRPKDIEADWVKLKCGNYNKVTQKCGGAS